MPSRPPQPPSGPTSREEFQNLEAEQARFEVGRATNYDVLFRIDELLNAQTTYLRAGLDYLRAKATLQALTGEILPAYGLDLPSN